MLLVVFGLSAELNLNQASAILHQRRNLTLQSVSLQSLPATQLLVFPVCPGAID
jgi:hypothetical protein